MQIFIWILGIAAVYFLLAFVGLRLVAPFMGFGGYRPPTKLSPEIRQTISQLESQSPSQFAYLKAAFDFTISRWYAVRHKAATQFFKLFRNNLEQIWRQPGYAHCTTQNFILYALLANSKFFSAEDIKVAHVFLNFVPHQYLKVKVGEKWVDVDPAATSAGITSFGKCGRLFG